MTADAKIGLLLGLVFIFIIAFLINGLPGFTRQSDSNALTTTMVNGDLGIGENERRVNRGLERVEVIAPPQIIIEDPEPAVVDDSVRFVMDLPGADKAVVEPLPARIPEPVIAFPPAAKISATPKYVVQSGDNLASIAKKFYGEDEGNRKVNIDAIYAANKDTLPSPDKLQVGQKLTIPPLGIDISQAQANAAPNLGSKLFEQVKSIGQRHFSKDEAKTGTYVVKDGDNLWKIAAQQLGNGIRYKEIEKLNSDTLGSKSSLQTGMKLQLPAK
ncbi:MAG: LysM peptidoglycan-binding domain-containing protein [Phycisphaerae bacterium]|nr:LysM peptidoglycan-binding domain-containing protein [Phycisphaerae bacterium]